jgi:hypothetical protein
MKYIQIVCAQVEGDMAFLRFALSRVAVSVCLFGFFLSKRSYHPEHSVEANDHPMKSPGDLYKRIRREDLGYDSWYIHVI